MNRLVLVAQVEGPSLLAKGPYILWEFFLDMYHTNSMYWDRYVSANSADQDQTASEEAV